MVAHVIGASMLVLAACGTRVEDQPVAAGPGSTVTSIITSGAADPTGSGTIDSGDGQTGEAATDGGEVGGGNEGVLEVGDDGGTGGGGAVPQGGPPIVIGSVQTKGGLVGDNGAGAVASLSAWAAAVNARGGINGRQVQLITIDDGGDPGRHASAVRKLIQEKHVVAFVGNYAPLTFSAGAPLIEEAGIPSIGGDSGEKGYFTSPNAFAFNGAAYPEGIAAGKWAPAALRDKTKLAVFYIAEIEFGARIAKHMADGWRAAGKEVVAYSSISLGQPDYTAEILQAQGGGAQVVAVYGDFSACRRFWDAARRQSYKPVWIGASACLDPSAIDAADQTTNNFYVSMPLEPPSSDLPAVREMREAMARYAPNFPHPEANGVLMRGWDSGKLFERVIEVSGGKTDSKSLIDALHSMTNETIYGLSSPLDWPPGPHPERTCGKMLKFNGDRYVTVTPEYVC